MKGEDSIIRETSILDEVATHMHMITHTHAHTSYFNLRQVKTQLQPFTTFQNYMANGKKSITTIYKLDDDDFPKKHGFHRRFKKTRAFTIKSNKLGLSP